MDPAQQKKAACQALSQAVMPSQLNSILSDIDTMLATARQTIDQSLQQSSQLVDQSRQHLARINQVLESDAPSGTLSEESADNDATLGAFSRYQDAQLEAQAHHLEEQNAHMKQVFTEQEMAAQKSAQAAQQAMEETLKNMEQQLIQQNQDFQNEVMQRGSEQPSA
ncbi:hypothetical protein JF50_00870 [Pseudoalteromonas luteoviolacea]|uniref:Uncharacterized protein n=1 Tax=Pseudoalteromonas luteoviolacea TaxID=43657 RepID=A0A0C1QEE8_9GAMM|nr:hypothetical protein [Pseudoalteromonas luteoviolacea]KID59041.1 hypothetical protein JF50_00870 [Pseudoalteromonas luteoviolacea]